MMMLVNAWMNQDKVHRCARKFIEGRESRNPNVRVFKFGLGSVSGKVA